MVKASLADPSAGSPPQQDLADPSRRVGVSDKTCTKCGAVYEVREIKVPMRDKDSFDCECGEQLASWNGARIPLFTLVKPGSPVSE